MLPPLLTSRLRSILGNNTDLVMDALDHERNGSFRMNFLK